MSKRPFFSHYTAWRRARMLSMPDDARPIYPHVEDARRELMCVLEGGAVCDSPGIEEYHVGIAAGTQQPTIMKAEACSDCPAHLADRLLQRQQLLLADVLRQHAWVGSIRAWMRRSQLLRPGRVYAACICRNLHPRLSQPQRDVRLVHAEVNGEDAVPF